MGSVTSTDLSCSLILPSLVSVDFVLTYVNILTLACFSGASREYRGRT